MDYTKFIIIFLTLLKLLSKILGVVMTYQDACRGIINESQSNQSSQNTNDNFNLTTVGIFKVLFFRTR